MSEIDRALSTLGLGPEATQSDIKQAYRDLAKVWHPDRFPNDPRVQARAQEKLKEINAAYRRLRAYSGRPNVGHRQTNGSRPEGSQPHNRRPRPEGSPPPQSPPPPYGPSPSTTRSTSPVPMWTIILGGAAVFLWIVYFAIENPQHPHSLPSSSGSATKSPIPGEASEESPERVLKRRFEELARRIAAAPLETRYVTASRLSLRRLPTEESETVGSLGRGQEITTQGEFNNWKRVVDPRTHAILGWVSASFLSSEKPAGTTSALGGSPLSPATPTRSETHFTVGSTWDDVLRIQGTPDRFTQDSFHYGASDVFFRNKRVVGWYNGYPKLKVVLSPSRPTRRLSHFTLGSTWDEVLAVQGTPDRFTSDSLHYGASDVYFRNGIVVNWYNGYPKLKVCLAPKEATSKTYFTVGSTIDEVLAVQGTPDRMTRNSLHYGASDVFFENGRVVRWYNGYPKLKVRLEPGR